jgi:hypothetical protein
MVFAQALVQSGTSKLEADGLLLDFCTEAEIETVMSLSPQEKNALKMLVRQRLGKLNSICFVHHLTYYIIFTIFSFMFIKLI